MIQLPDYVVNSCPITPVGVELRGFYLLLRRGDVEPIQVEQTRIHSRKGLVDCIGDEDWLRRAFPVYAFTLMGDSAGGSAWGVMPDQMFHLKDAIDWLIDQCFAASGYTPPSERANRSHFDYGQGGGVVTPERSRRWRLLGRLPGAWS
jgi:hypothetical protein